MSTPLKPGDPITVIWVPTAEARVLALHFVENGRLDLSASGAGNTATRFLQDEHITWLRGAHTDDSSAVQAMRAAMALASGMREVRCVPECGQVVVDTYPFGGFCSAACREQEPARKAVRRSSVP